jgi:ATP-dependent helicase/nuclease subunit B
LKGVHLHALLDSQVTVLTASRRLSHALRLGYAQHARDRGLSVWPTPRVLPWSTWLRQQWLETRAAAHGERHLRLLTPAQARILWSDVVASSAAGSELLSPAQAARLAARSWQRLHEYLIPLSQLSTSAGAESQTLYAWCREFLHRCESMQAVDEARLAAWADESGFTPAEPIALAGFDAIAPSARRLIERWRAEGKVAEAAATHGPVGSVSVVGWRDPQVEIEAAARWARAQMEAGRSNIAIVVPDLQTRRAEVRRAFEDVFAPGARATRAEAMSLPVVIAAPEPLASYPIVDAALLILQLAVPECSAAQAGRLLRSPFLDGGDGEADRRARADFKLREDQRDQWDWFELERWAGATGCDRLQLAARAITQQIRAETQRATASRWAERFHSWLRAAGWPGERTLNSVEHQTVLKFGAALAELGTLDGVLPALPLTSALARLQELLRETPFEPETQPAAVTVIDPTTVAGMTFEAAWITGLDATRLPGPVSPDALLPIELQRAAEVPEASAEGVLQQAKIRLQRLVSCAPEVVLSWPQQEGEAQLQPSPLLASWPRRKAEELPLAAVRSLRRTLFAQRPALNEIEDPQLPALRAGTARGGSYTIELQSRCAFRAQAELRLHARRLPRVSIGVEPADRGTIMHEVLKELWGELRSQQALRALDDEALADQVRSAVQRHVARELQPTTRHRGRLAALEVERLTRLIVRLLVLEKERPAFAVRSAEAAEAFEIGGLAITLQPDRIDELPGGGHLLIDYKLGDVHQPRQWLDAWPGRPKRPQLPLYGLAHEQTLSALAFVVLSSGAVEYRGWSNGAQVGPGVVPYPPNQRGRLDAPPDWASLLQQWRATLTNLAEQFVAGAASVDPLPQECTMCHLSTLCRIHERARLESGLTNDD